MFLYLDTSALVKRYIAEPEAEEVAAVMNAAIAVGTSLITRTEVAAALAKAVREGRLNDHGSRQAHREFLEDWPDFGRVPVTEALATRGDLVTIPVPTTHLTRRSSRAFSRASSVSSVTWSPWSAARAMALAMTSAWSRSTPRYPSSRAVSRGRGRARYPASTALGRR